MICNISDYVDSTVLESPKQNAPKKPFILKKKKNQLATLDGLESEQCALTEAFARIQEEALHLQESMTRGDVYGLAAEVDALDKEICELKMYLQDSHAPSWKQKKILHLSERFVHKAQEFLLGELNEHQAEKAFTDLAGNLQEMQEPSKEMVELVMEICDAAQSFYLRSRSAKKKLLLLPCEIRKRMEGLQGEKAAQALHVEANRLCQDTCFPIGEKEMRQWFKEIEQVSS